MSCRIVPPVDLVEGKPVPLPASDELSLVNQPLSTHVEGANGARTVADTRLVPVLSVLSSGILSASDRQFGVETPLSCVFPAERNIRSILCGYRVRLVEALTKDTGHHLVAKSTLMFACQCYLRPISHVLSCGGTAL